MTSPLFLLKLLTRPFLFVCLSIFIFVRCSLTIEYNRKIDGSLVVTSKLKKENTNGTV